MSTESPRLQTAALVVIRLVGAWILAGAVAKLFWGSPNLMPVAIRELPLGVNLTYRLVIVVELCLAWLAFAKPRWGWPLLAGTLLVFDGLLAQMIASGETKCGCFGSQSPPPSLMLTIDTVMLLGLVVTQPWRSVRRKGLGPVPLVALCAVTSVAAWLYIGSVIATPDVGPKPGSGNGNGDPVDEVWSLPDSMPRFVTLEMDDWKDQALIDTALATWIDPILLPTDGTVAFYRQTCEHCAAHLERLADEDIGMPITLIRVVEDHDNEENKLTIRVPEGPHVTKLELPTGTEWVIDTPWNLEVEGGMVVSTASAEGE